MKSARKKTPKQARATSVATSHSHWPPPIHTSAKPASTVRLIFAGLLGFCFTSRGTCQVGFRNTAGHKPKIVIFENPGCNDHTLYPGPSAMSLGITGAFGTPSVTSHQGNFPPDRLTGDREDIRWLIDLADWFPGSVAQPGMFSPILEVFHGMFFTLVRSNSTFNQTLSNGIPVNPMGYVSRYLGVDIELRSKQSVTLQIGGASPIHLPSGASTSAEVVFANECVDCNTSDFHDLIAALGSVPTDYDLGVDIPVNLQNLPGGCFQTAKGPFSEFNTDPSPCMGAGFGGNDGFQ
jgi:hypothetical protein